MPTWLSDPSNTFYVVMFAISLIVIGVWVRNRDRRSHVAAIAVVVVFALIILCDRTVDSPRESAVRGVEDISAALNERNTDLLLSHVSDSFEYKGKKKADIRHWVELARQHNVRTGVWDFDRERVVEVSENEIDIVFNGKVIADGKDGPPFHFKTRFVKDRDGKWRLKTFTTYDVMRKEQGGETPIPGI